MFSIRYKPILLIILFSFSCTTFGSKPEKPSVDHSKVIQELIIETAVDVPDIYAEEIQEYLEEELKIVKKAKILDLDKDEINIIKSSPKLSIDIQKKPNFSFIKFIGLGIIPTWERNELNIQVKFFKNNKEIANWSFNQKSVSWYSIWFLPWMNKYDPLGKVVVKNAIHNIINDIIKDNLL